jgi:hypothetical protein
MESSDRFASLSSVSDVTYLEIQRSGLGIKAAYYKPVEPKAPVTKGDRNWESALKSSRHGQSKTVRKGTYQMVAMTKKEALSFKTQSLTNTASVEAVITKNCGCEAYKAVFTYGRWGAQGFSPKKGETAHSISTLVEKEGQKPYWHTAKLFCLHQVQPTQEPKAPKKAPKFVPSSQTPKSKALKKPSTKKVSTKKPSKLSDSELKAAKAALTAPKPSAPTELDFNAIAEQIAKAVSEATAKAVIAAFSATK